MAAQIRSIYSLAREEIVQAAREQATAGEPLSHGFAPDSPQAATYILAYRERERELDALAAEVI